MNLISFLLLYKMDLKLVNANKGWHCSVFPMEDFFFFLHFSFCSNIQMLFSVCSVHGLVCVCARHSSWETGVKLQDWDLSKNITMSRLWNTSWKKHYKWVSFLMDDHLNDSVFDTVVHLEDWKMLKVVTFKQLSLAVILPSEEPTAATQGVHWDDFICFYF